MFCRNRNAQAFSGRINLAVQAAYFALHHHLAASGNFGQVLRKNYPVVAVTETADKEEITIVGPLCTPLDLLGDRVTIGEVGIGSLIAIL